MPETFIMSRNNNVSELLIDCPPNLIKLLAVKQNLKKKEGCTILVLHEKL